MNHFYNFSYLHYYYEHDSVQMSEFDTSPNKRKQMKERASREDEREETEKKKGRKRATGSYIWSYEKVQSLNVL